MPPETHSAFFSYSREDSEFVLRLAKDLKAAGAVVWMDQIDIRPGQHWDSALEEALGSCPNMLLILSPASVSSQNVMDEVSFALDEQKLILPVLYRTCKIPLRLRRLQYIDARTDYEGALSALLRLLAPDSEAAAERELRKQEQQQHFVGMAGATTAPQTPRTGAAPEKETDRGGPSEAHKPPLPAPVQIQQAAQKSKKWWLIAAVIGLMAIGIWSASKSPERHEQASYQAPAPAPVDTPAKSAESGMGSGAQTPGEPLKESTQSTQAPPSASQWTKSFIQALEGPSISDLRPYFDDVVSPYYGLAEADWNAVARDKQNFFRAYPEIQYTILGEPTESTRSPDKTAVEADVRYEVIDRNGQHRTGISHLWMDLHLVDGAWKLAGVREKVRQ